MTHTNHFSSYVYICELMAIFPIYWSTGPSWRNRGLFDRINPPRTYTTYIIPQVRQHVNAKTNKKKMDEESSSRDECLEATRNLLENYPIDTNEFILNMEDCLYEEQVITTIPQSNNNNNTDGDLTPVVTCPSTTTVQQSNDDENSSSNNNTIETDLTSLNWLHNITNIMAVPNLPTPPVSPKPPKKKVQNNNNGQQEDLTININYYKRNGEKKPPFSYATLICMAMGRNGNKMTLSAIYHWIRENFLYYRKAHPSWQVSSKKIRLVCLNCLEISSIFCC